MVDRRLALFERRRARERRVVEVLRVPRARGARAGGAVDDAVDRAAVEVDVEEVAAGPGSRSTGFAAPPRTSDVRRVGQSVGAGIIAQMQFREWSAKNSAPLYAAG